VHAVRREAEPLRDQMAEARRIEHTARRNDPVLGQTAELPRDPGHDVTRVAHNDDDGVGTVLDELRYDALEDANVLLDKIESGLALLLTRSGRYDYDLRPLQRATGACNEWLK